MKYYLKDTDLDEWAENHLSHREIGWLVIANFVPAVAIIGAVAMRNIDTTGPPGCAAILTLGAFCSIIVCPIAGAIGFFKERNKKNPM